MNRAWYLRSSLLDRPAVAPAPRTAALRSRLLLGGHGLGVGLPALLTSGGDEVLDGDHGVDRLSGQGRGRFGCGVGDVDQFPGGVGIAQRVGDVGVGVVRAQASCTAVPVN